MYPSASYGMRSRVFESVVVSSDVTFKVFLHKSHTLSSMAFELLKFALSVSFHGYRTTHAANSNGGEDDAL